MNDKKINAWENLLPMFKEIVSKVGDDKNLFDLARDKLNNLNAEITNQGYQNNRMNGSTHREFVSSNAPVRFTNARKNKRNHSPLDIQHNHCVFGVVICPSKLISHL